MPWNPERYHQFQSERFAPFADLLALVHIRTGLRVIDLGCGTGELTRRLADALPESEVLGVDNSPEMLARAQAQGRPGLRFALADARDMRGTWDLVFSHAVIQWLEDHESLIQRLYSLVAPGGQLTVQMPSNHAHPTQKTIREVAGEEPFRSALGGWTRQAPVLAVERYADLLYGQGGQELTVFEKVSPHVLADADALADWVSGTALVPYFERLDPPLQDHFMARYRARLRDLYPGSPVFYPFRRILFAAGRAPQTA
jgi:trans-aconitate 2-methyltransferase